MSDLCGVVLRGITVACVGQLELVGLMICSFFIIIFTVLTFKDAGLGFVVLSVQIRIE